MLFNPHHNNYTLPFLGMKIIPTSLKNVKSNHLKSTTHHIFLSRFYFWKFENAQNLHCHFQTLSRQTLCPWKLLGPYKQINQVQEKKTCNLRHLLTQAFCPKKNRTTHSHQPPKQGFPNSGKVELLPCKTAPKQVALVSFPAKRLTTHILLLCHVDWRLY